MSQHPDFTEIIDLIESWPDFNLSHAMRRAAEKCLVEAIRLPDGRVAVVFLYREARQ